MEQFQNACIFRFCKYGKHVSKQEKMYLCKLVMLVRKELEKKACLISSRVRCSTVEKEHKCEKREDDEKER